jgi:GAG-pre-integrase domain/Integrase core domain
MTNVKKIPERKFVTANNEALVCNQLGDVDVRMYDPEGDMITTARLRKVLCVPGLHASLLSCAAPTKSPVEVTFTSDGCHLVDQDDGQLIGYGTKGADGLCVLMADVVHQSIASVAAESSVNLWHARLDHVSKATIRDMVRKKKAKGITLREGEDVIDCDECCTGKQTRKTFSGRISTAKKVGDVIHSDVCGPILPSLGGHKYFVLFIDKKSRSGTLALLSREGDVKEAFKAFKTRFEKENDTVIKMMHSDRGGEYESLKEYLNEEGVILEMTAAYCPESNGIAERFNRNILDKARSMLSHAKLNHEFWSEAVKNANYESECRLEQVMESSQVHMRDGQGTSQTFASSRCLVVSVGYMCPIRKGRNSIIMHGPVSFLELRDRIRTGCMIQDQAKSKLYGMCNSMSQNSQERQGTEQIGQRF